MGLTSPQYLVMLALYGMSTNRSFYTQRDVVSLESWSNVYRCRRIGWMTIELVEVPFNGNARRAQPERTPHHHRRGAPAAGPTDSARHHEPPRYDHRRAPTPGTVALTDVINRTHDLRDVVAGRPFADSVQTASNGHARPAAARSTPILAGSRPSAELHFEATPWSRCGPAESGEQPGLDDDGRARCRSWLHGPPGRHWARQRAA